MNEMKNAIKLPDSIGKSQVLQRQRQGKYKNRQFQTCLAHGLVLAQINKMDG